MGDKQFVLLSDPISTGWLYVEDILKRGYEPIVLMPRLHMPEEVKEDMLDHYFSPMLESLPEGTKVIWEDEDYEKTLEELRKYPIVMAVNGSEMGAIVIDRINNDLGLKGNPIEFSQSHRDKDVMQDMLRRAGLRHIVGKTVKSVEEAAAFLDETGLEDVIVKPVNGAASAGLHVCSCKEEALKAVEHNLKNHSHYATPEKGLLVQERIVGDEYVVNTVSCNGRHVITDVWMYRKICLNTDGNIYDCMTLITELEPKHIALCEYALSAVEALGIKYGPTHGEYMMDERGPVLIECGARPMGGGMPKSFLDKCLGHHITDVSLDAFLNPEVFEEVASKPYRPNCSAMLKVLVAKRDRSVMDVPLHAIVQNLSSVHTTELAFLESGSPIKRTIDLDTSPGCLYMAHENETMLLRDYQIVLNLENGYASMLYGLDDLELERLSDIHWDASVALAQAGAVLGDGELVVLTTDADHCDAPGLVDLRTIYDFDDAGNTNNAKTAVLHLSGSLKEMEGFLRLFAEAVSRFKFGRIVATEQSFDHFPYGKRGLAQLMRLNGYVLDVPTVETRGMLIASRVEEP